MAFRSKDILCLDDMNFHCALMILQQFEQANIPHSKIVLIHKLLPSTYHPCATPTPTSKPDAPLAPKSRKTDESLASKVFIHVPFGDTLVAYMKRKWR